LNFDVISGLTHPLAAEINIPPLSSTVKELIMPQRSVTHPAFLSNSPGIQAWLKTF
jgi:hypothetical protein